MEWLCSKCHKPKVNPDEAVCIDCRQKKKDRDWFIIGMTILIVLSLVYVVAIFTIVGIGGIIET